MASYEATVRWRRGYRDFRPSVSIVSRRGLSFRVDTIGLMRKQEFRATHRAHPMVRVRIAGGGRLTKKVAHHEFALPGHSCTLKFERSCNVNRSTDAAKSLVCIPSTAKSS